MIDNLNMPMHRNMSSITSIFYKSKIIQVMCLDIFYIIQFNLYLISCLLNGDMTLIRCEEKYICMTSINERDSTLWPGTKFYEIEKITSNTHDQVFPWNRCFSYNWQFSEGSHHGVIWSFCDGWYPTVWFRICTC